MNLQIYRVRSVILWIFFVLSAIISCGWCDATLKPIIAIDSPQPLKYTMAVLRDRSGFLWVGTEGNGVWRYDASKEGAAAWRQFVVKDGLGDDFCYTLAQDLQGRIWVGHATAGVSVWNGLAWANYGPLDNGERAATGLSGPLGERIFSIAVSPSNGDVFLATNQGISIYSPRNDLWSYRTRRDGLPSNQVQAVAVDSYGNLFAGTQCEGIAKSNQDSQFKIWAITKGPSAMPNSAEGQGLPSNQINDVLVTDNDTVYAATKNGLARSNDMGENWSFIRGQDWEKRIKGRTNPLTPVPREGSLKTELLREDYVTSLAEDPNGLLVIGYRTRGFEIRRPVVNRPAFLSAPDGTSDFPYVSTVWTQEGGRPILGFYNGGVQLGDSTPPFVPTQEEKTAFAGQRGWKKNLPALPSQPVRLPSGAKSPTLAEVDELVNSLLKSPAPLAVGSALVEGDDWRTKGDWVGRYGRDYAVLCAARAPLNHYVTLDNNYAAQGMLGTHIRGKDSLRHWVHWVKTDNNNALYDPVIGYRRQAEWDDHGETYPFDFEGPDVWVRVKVPEGIHRLSLYLFNKDGLYGFNRARDYLIEVKSGNANDVKAAENEPALAQSRVRDFWNGVYKKFVVRGPADYWVKVGRDGSFNTILSSVMLDKISGSVAPVTGRPLNYMGQVSYEPPPLEGLSYVGAPQEPVLQRARIWEWKIESAIATVGGAADAESVRILALRSLMAQPKNLVPPALLTRWRWKAALWTRKDREAWATAMEEGQNSYFAINPQARKVER